MRMRPDRAPPGCLSFEIRRLTFRSGGNLGHWQLEFIGVYLGQPFHSRQELRAQNVSQSQGKPEGLNKAVARTYVQIGWLAFVGLAIVAVVVAIWLGP